MSPLSRDEIVVTGLASWSCFGRGMTTLMDNIVANERGFRRVNNMPLNDAWFTTDQAMQIVPSPTIFNSQTGTEYDVELHEWPSAFGVETAVDAWLDSGITESQYPSHRVGVFNGTSHGANHGLLAYLKAIADGDRPDPALLGRTTPWTAREIARRVKASGMNMTINTACSSGINSIGQAIRMIMSGRIDCALAGGVDSFSLVSFVGFSSLMSLDPKGCRPFDVDRRGLSLGDGAAYCVVERASAALRRGGAIRAVLGGYASAGEGYHSTAPDPSGRGAMQVMCRALETMQDPQELAFVSAHGTGTPANDGAEAKAIAQVLDKFGIYGPVPVASLKSQIGHSLGSAGALQTVATIGCMNRGVIPGTVGLKTHIEVAKSIRFPLCAEQGEIALALVNAFGFGGSVASLCIRKYPHP